MKEEKLDIGKLQMINYSIDITSNNLIRLIINLRLLARRKHEANFNKPVLDGILWLVKERPERGARITNCAGEELIGTARASGDAAVVGCITGVGGA
ncbi:hypothetical protein LXL04_023893 [Taraxacum kok-saghyz]